MKAAKITMRILVILFTSVWGVFFGIITPIVIMSDKLLPAGSDYIIVVWLITAVTGYFIPCFLVMLNFSKAAAGFSIAGTILTLYIHSALTSLEHNASFMYLPQIFMTIFTVIYIFIINHNYIGELNKKRIEKRDAPAPSILSAHRTDTDKSTAKRRKIQ